MARPARQGSIVPGAARRLRRLGRRLRRAWGPARAQILYNRLYSFELPQLGFDPNRAVKILAFLEGERLVRRRDLHRSRRISLASLAEVHDQAYLESLQEPGALTALLGFQPSDELQERFLAASRAMVGGTTLAARLALTRRTVAVNLGGGFHHAARARGQGFCAFNDIAVAVRKRRRRGFRGRVLVVDLDLHDGEGTRSLFATDPDVHTYSVHNRDLEPLAAVASTGIALGDDVGDERYLEALRDTLPPLFWAVRPDLVFYVAGCDPAADDRRGTWRITPEAMLERDRLVVGLTRRTDRQVPLVVTLGGGYGQGAWRYTARLLSWLLGGPHGPEPPAALEVPLEYYRRRLQKLTEGDLVAEPAEDDWGLTEADLSPLRTPHPSRFLGYYSKHGLELVMERFGFFQYLRDRGHKKLRVEWDLEDHAGQMLRIVSMTDEGPRTLLELRARRDRTTLPGRELLSLEWLLTQDPGGRFRAERGRLPGQERPGLGILPDIVAVIMLAAEQLGVDGIVFSPAHYAIAERGHHLACFLDPEAEGRFRALERALRGLHPVEAARALAEGRVVDGATGEAVAWQPASLIMPVDRTLAHELKDERWRRAVTEAQGRYRFEVRGAD